MNLTLRRSLIWGVLTFATLPAGAMAHWQWGTCDDPFPSPLFCRRIVVHHYWHHEAPQVCWPYDPDYPIEDAPEEPKRRVDGHKDGHKHKGKGRHWEHMRSEKEDATEGSD